MLSKTHLTSHSRMSGSRWVWVITPGNTEKRCPFHYRGLECKLWSQEPPGNRQIWPWITEWSRAKANRVLPRECTGHSKHPLPTTQQKTLPMDIKMVNTKIRLNIFFAANDGEALYSQQKEDQYLTVAHHELLIAKFRLKLKKVGKTARPFRFHLNQIAYDYM